MSKTNLLSHYYNDLLDKLNFKQAKELLTPFFWPHSSALGENEGYHLFLFFHDKKRSVFRSPLKLIKCCFYNLLYNALIVFRTLNVALFHKHSTKIIKGTLSKETTHLFMTWVHPQDIDNFCTHKQLYIWNNILNEIETPKNQSQVLFFSTFKLRPDQRNRLLEKNCLLVEPSGAAFSIMSFVAVLLTFLRTFFAFVWQSKSNALTLNYLASSLSYRAWFSRALYTTFSRLLNQHQQPLKIFFPWEAQPEQKALCLAANENRHETFGYIHASVTDRPDYLFIPRKFPDLGPKTYFVHGTSYLKLFKELMIPYDKIITIKSQRFAPKDFSSQKGTLFLPYSKKDTLDYLRKISPLTQGGFLQITSVKPHPTLKDDIQVKNAIKKISLVKDGDNIAVAGFSTVIMEIIETGNSVIQITQDEKLIISSDVYANIEVETLGQGVQRLSLKKENQGSYLLFSGPSLHEYI